MKKLSIIKGCIPLLLMIFSSVGNAAERTHEPCDENKYQGNMIVIVQVVSSDRAIIKDCEIAAFDSNGECRASEFATEENDGIVLLTVQGEGQSEPLFFNVVYDDNGSVDERVKENTVFENDGIIGTISEPYILKISLVTSITAPSVDNGKEITIKSIDGGVEITTRGSELISIYSVGGSIVYQNEISGCCNISLPSGIYIINGEKIAVK